MNVFWAALVIVVFSLIVGGLGLPDRAREVIVRARESLSVLRDSVADDRAKEKALQRHAARLSVLVGILAGGSLVAISLPLLGVWLLELGGVTSLEGVLSILERVDFLAGATVVGILIYLTGYRVRQS